MSEPRQNSPSTYEGNCNLCGSWNHHLSLRGPLYLCPKCQEAHNEQDAKLAELKRKMDEEYYRERYLADPALDAPKANPAKPRCPDCQRILVDYNPMINAYICTYCEYAWTQQNLEEWSPKPTPVPEIPKRYRPPKALKPKEPYMTYKETVDRVTKILEAQGIVRPEDLIKPLPPDDQVDAGRFIPTLTGFCGGEEPERELTEDERRRSDEIGRALATFFDNNPRDGSAWGVP